MDSLKDLLRSRKFRGMLIGMITTIVVGMGLEPEVANGIVPYLATIVCSYILGQGIADHGKEKAKIEGAVDTRFSGPSRIPEKLLE